MKRCQVSCDREVKLLTPQGQQTFGSRQPGLHVRIQDTCTASAVRLHRNGDDLPAWQCQLAAADVDEQVAELASTRTGKLGGPSHGHRGVCDETDRKRPDIGIFR